MPNRAERRKAAKDQRRGVPSQYDQTRGRAQSGMLDEYALQEKSRRIQEGVDDSGVWKPSARTEVDEEVESVFEANPNYQDPKAFKAPHSVRQWFRVGSWTLIALSVIAFFVVMWLPTHPLWLILTVSVVFVVMDEGGTRVLLVDGTEGEAQQGALGVDDDLLVFLVHGHYLADDAADGDYLGSGLKGGAEVLHLLLLLLGLAGLPPHHDADQHDENDHDEIG